MATGSSEGTSPDTEFGIKDISALHESLCPVSAKYKFFGLQIGVDINEIKKIKANCDDSSDCLLEILCSRLNQEPALTCADICKALQSRSVNERQLAISFQSRFECQSISDQHKRKNEIERESGKKQRAEKVSESAMPLRMSEKESESENIQSAEVERQVHERDESKSIMAEKRACKKETAVKNECASQQGEMKELVNIFERFFGKLCCAVFDPKDVAAELQSVGLISKSIMRNMMLSPESQQAKIIALVDELDKLIKSCPDRLFIIIEVMLENEALQETARKMLRQACMSCFACPKTLF